MKFPFFKNTQGEPSASLTMLLWSWMAVTLWLVIWLTGAWFGIEIPAFDATAAVAYLTPLLTLYGARRYTDKKTEEKKGKEES